MQNAKHKVKNLGLMLRVGFKNIFFCIFVLSFAFCVLSLFGCVSAPIKELPAPVKPKVSLLNIRKIVLDPGHGGADPGAIGRSGLREKDVNLDVAKRLARLLRQARVEVVMTRSSDSTVSLERRVEIANNAQPDIFISIHSNANRSRGLNGFEVYCVSSVHDTKRALSSAKNTPLNLDQSYFSNPTLNLKATLWDMIYTANRAESIELARSICRSINRDLDTKVLGIKNVGFYVLKWVQAPAILIEIGFLSNPDEERRLKNSYYRQQIAESITRGIKNYADEYLLARQD